jgi:hypothetical protein
MTTVSSPAEMTPAMWPFPSDAPVAEIREHLTEIAVFRLSPSHTD